MNERGDREREKWPGLHCFNSTLNIFAELLAPKEDIGHSREGGRDKKVRMKRKNTIG